MGIRSVKSWRAELANRKSQIANPPPLCSHLNQSLMELGALVCLPRHPRCDACPVAELCVARKQHRIEELPWLPPRAPATRRRFVAFVASRNGKYLVRQRPAGAVNAHLWEFPNTEVANEDGNPKPAALKLFGSAVTGLEPLCTIRHSITRYRIRLDVFETQGVPPIPRNSISAKWVPRHELKRLAFASAHKKILARL
jgi:A/G-specific adenine glycosylase